MFLELPSLDNVKLGSQIKYELDFLLKIIVYITYPLTTNDEPYANRCYCQFTTNFLNRTFEIQQLRPCQNISLY